MVESVKKRPNILLIVADDLGWSDVGAFGGEIKTPNLDKLAHNGIRLTDFHTASMCSPTRSMLLSGTDNHIAGLGQMAYWGDAEAPWKKQPGYEGYLNWRVAALPEILQDNGYFTTMSGKWHLGLTVDRAPHARGFDRSFALLPGGANHYAYEPCKPDGTPVFAHWQSLYFEDDKKIDIKTFSKDYYSSDNYATKLISFLEEHKERQAINTDADQPFFAFLPFTAPHWPLQAPPEVVKKYAGIYDNGPDVLRQKRLETQIKLGLLSKDVEPHSVSTDTKEWDDMTPEEKLWSAKTMEVYAAMVDRMDWNIGRVLDYLDEMGEREDTFILFMSDNGAEGAVVEAIPMTGEIIKKSIDKHYNNDLENLGNGDSFIWYGPRWAQAATAPSSMHKGYVTEGGIRCPAIINYPALFGHDNDKINNAFMTVMDILPTLLDLTNTPSPETDFRGREVVSVKGKSWLPYLTGQAPTVHDEEYYTGWELFFHQAVRKGKYKAVYIPAPKGPEKWQLYDIENDKGEVHDLSEKEPEVLDMLIKYWVAYVAECGVFLREDFDKEYMLPKIL